MLMAAKRPKMADMHTEEETKKRKGTAGRGTQ